MADLQNFSVTPGSAATITVPTATIAGTFVDSGPGGAVLADLTGANALHFPAVMATLSAQQRATLIDLVAGTLLAMKAGLA